MTETLKQQISLAIGELFLSPIASASPVALSDASADAALAVFRAEQKEEDEIVSEALKSARHYIEANYDTLRASTIKHLCVEDIAQVDNAIALIEKRQQTTKPPVLTAEQVKAWADEPAVKNAVHRDGGRFGPDTTEGSEG